MTWTTRIKQISPGTASQYQILNEGKPLNFREVIALWRTNASFNTFYNDILATSPFPAFYWEHPALTDTNLGTDYEFVLVNSSALAMIHSDPKPFQEKFVLGQEAVRFPNLRADAELVSPTPKGNDLSLYAHLGRFVRSGEPKQQQAFWQLVGVTATELIGRQACWLSTSGLGVHWLHVRFDKRPKYYTHRPYVRN